MLSSSGFRDGLGERDLRFDRESGEVRERLFLRPELAAYESALRRRIGRLASMADPRLVPVHSVEHDRATGRLAVLSRHVSGTRLSDTLAAAREREVVPDLTVGLFLAAEILSAAHTFHALSGLAHGALSPDRVIVTAEADVVLADYAYAEALKAAHFTPERLWEEFGVAHSLGKPYSFAGDVRQAGLIAIALMLGRPLDGHEMARGIDALVAEVDEAAMIRGGRLFAEPVVSWITRTLGRGHEPPFTACDEAADACAALLTDRERATARPAFLQFLLELESVSDVSFEPRRQQPEPLEVERAPSELPAPEPLLSREPEPLLADIEADAPEAEPVVLRPALRLVERPAAPELESDPRIEVEPALGPAASAAPEPAPIFAWEPEPLVAPEQETVAEQEVATVANDSAAAHFLDPEPVRFEPSPTFSYEPLSDVAAGEPAPEPEPEPAYSWQPSESRYVSELGGLELPVEPAASTPEPIHFSPEPVGFSPEPIESSPEPMPLPTAAVPAALPVVEPAPEPQRDLEPVAARQGAELQELTIQTASPAKEDAGPRVSSPSPFALLDKIKKRARMISAGAAGPEGVHASVPPAPIVVPAPPPVIPSPAPVAAAPIALPVPPPISVPAAIHAVTTPAESPFSPVSIRLKDSPSARSSSVARRELSERPVAIFEHEEQNEGSGFRIPWKVAAAAVALVVSGFVAMTMDWSGSSRAAAIAPGTLVVETTPPGSDVFIDGEKKGVTPAVVQVTPGRHEMKLARKGAEHAYSIDVASGARRIERLDWTALRQTGGIEVVSNQSGSKVLVDGKPRGETPLVLGDLAPGRHLVVVQGPNGNVRRRVTVVAGETTKLDLAIYSGWVIVSAPIELQIFEGGKQIATAGEGPVMLSAGPHTLELVNELLAYRSSHGIDIRPGEEERLTITPKGRINVNAVPWAEVFVDGERIGETPLANVKVTIGARELLFKHPEHGERRMPITVTGGEPAQISVDMTRPSSP